MTTRARPRRPRLSGHLRLPMSTCDTWAGKHAKALETLPPVGRAPTFLQSSQRKLTICEFLPKKEKERERGTWGGGMFIFLNTLGRHRGAVIDRGTIHIPSQRQTKTKMQNKTASNNATPADKQTLKELLEMLNKKILFFFYSSQ